MKNKTLTESLVKITKDINKSKKQSTNKQYIIKENKELKESLYQSVNFINTRNYKTSFDLSKGYEKALQEGIQKVYPDAHWTQITKCDILSTLLENKNNINSTINKILAEQYYKDSGSGLTDSGEILSDEDIREMWEENHLYDPSMAEYSSFEEWMSDTINNGYIIPIEESLKETLKLKKPKYWNSAFAVKVLDAYDSGELTKDNIKEWETKYNGGIEPNPSLGSKEIIDYYLSGNDIRKEYLKEDTIKQDGYWVNKGDEGTHGKFKTKKEADAQRKAMFAQGYKESLKESADQFDLNSAVYNALSEVCYNFYINGHHPTEEEMDYAIDWFQVHFWEDEYEDDFDECLTEDKDLSNVKKSTTYVLTNIRDKWQNAKSVDEIYKIISNAFNEAGLKSEGANKILYTIKKQKSPIGAIQFLYNSILAGSNKRVI